MDTTRSTRRPGALLAVALAATTGFGVLAPGAPVAAATQAGDPTTVVVTAAVGGVEAAAAAVRAAGGAVLHRLPLVGGVGAELPAGAVLAPSYAVSPNVSLSLTGGGKTGPDRAPTAIREALGLGAPAGQGAGTKIAVVDTGVAETADLVGRVTHVPVAGVEVTDGLHDGFGHGTFIAGAAAGDGSASGGTYAGVAPGAQILDVRVAGNDGSTDLVTVLAGLQAAGDAGADVVNLSMSSDSPLPYQLDPLTLALDRLWTRGVVVVVPSGNDGPSTGSVSAPGSDPMLLTVGALDERLTPGDRSDDVVPAFSGRGPTAQGDAKPDLVAPGRSLVSLRAPGSLADRENPGAVVVGSSDAGSGSYFRGSGTSFSTALVSGAVALLRERHQGLRPDQAKRLLSDTTYSAKGLRDVRDAGRGGLDLSAALAATAPPVVADAVMDAPPPGDEAAWEAFIAAIEAGDRKAAGAAWALISLEGHRWAANSWSANSWSGHRWAANSWSGHRWAGEDGTADEWQMRIWAGHRWAGHRWAGHRWAGQRWAGHRWAASRWAASRWAASRWAGAWE